MDKQLQHRVWTGPEDATKVSALLAQSSHWDFDVFELYEESQSHALLRLGTHFFQGHDLYTVLGVDQTAFANFLGDVEAGYLPVPYHNSIHAADVLQSVNHFIISTSMDAKFPVVDKFCLLVAAAGHDLGHPGTNNLFQVMAQTPFAVFYNDAHVRDQCDGPRQSERLTHPHPFLSLRGAGSGELPRGLALPDHAAAGPQHHERVAPPAVRPRLTDGCQLPGGNTEAPLDALPYSSSPRCAALWRRGAASSSSSSPPTSPSTSAFWASSTRPAGAAAPSTPP